MTPTQRTLAKLRADGWTTAIVEIPLTKQQVTIVDADSPAIGGTKWVATATATGYYAVRGKGATREYMHRLVAGAAKGRHVDHINGDTLDNRRCNLRLCTSQQNAWNQRPRGTYKGVARHRNMFTARLTFYGRNLYLGLFATQEDAARAYDAAARKYFGEFARCNFE